MPPPTRLTRTLLDRRVPIRTRLGLLRAELRRRFRPKPIYAVPYGRGALYLSHADYEIDWETLKNVLADEPYPTDYSGAVVLDIGAHKGYYGAYALVHGARRVISYEPEVENVKHLERSVASFDVRGDSWRVEQVAVGAHAGDAELHVMGASWGHSLNPPEAFSTYEIGVQRVPVVAIADVLEEIWSLGERRSRVVIKINTEGEECETILGTPPQAWDGVDELLVETHPWASCQADDLAAHLAVAGLSRVESAHPRMLQLRRGALPRSGRRSAPR